MVDRLKLTLRIVDTPIYVSNPIGGTTNIYMICEDIRVTYLSHHFSCNLFVLDFIGFEVLLGMDWLSKYEVVLDCVKSSTGENKVSKVY